MAGEGPARRPRPRPSAGKTRRRTRIVATWSSHGGSSIDMYYAGTGNYAGANAAVTADTFVFGARGVYSSEHTGATGMVGNMKTYQQRYKGTYAIAPWEITIKRTDGVTTVYGAYLEAVRGGMVLHLQDKKYTGMSYALVRGK